MVLHKRKTPVPAGKPPYEDIRDRPQRCFICGVVYYPGLDIPCRCNQITGEPTERRSGEDRRHR